ncbi:hypothetical protein GCM10011499_07480 [Pelagibacterium lentulum]|uniref:Uncharacterized protein n=2 Tax=Pelagibacterium lentulum TaxID=2029865 RepID=A0A916R9X9_9HYPH|nr:hypothetical protein GCM10011499_07480 [Pelagibacterium lentulum]
MDQASEEKMVILLISERSSDGHVINELSRYFSAMLSALVIRHGLQQTWVAAGRIVIQKANSDTQQCSISLVSDLGRKFDARLSVFALPHDPSREFRRREDHWVIRT